jgi:hypothetical protein
MPGKEKRSATVHVSAYLREEINNRPGIDIFHEVRMMGGKQTAHLLYQLVPGDAHCEDIASSA